MEKIFGFVTMDINPGKTDVFQETALRCIEAARTDPAGTQAYEWFISSDGSTAYVIEIYDDMDAIVQHSKNCGPHMMEIKKLVSMGLEFGGAASPEFLERMQERLGAVSFLGNKFQGLLNEAATNVAGDGCGKNIFALARWTVHVGKEEQFRTLAADALAKVKANEPGTLGYEFFLSADGRECLTLDIYDGAKALGDHRKNAGAIVGEILKIVDSDVTILGAIPDEMLGSFKDGLGISYFGKQIGGIL